MILKHAGGTEILFFERAWTAFSDILSQTSEFHGSRMRARSFFSRTHTHPLRFSPINSIILPLSFLPEEKNLWRALGRERRESELRESFSVLRKSPLSFSRVVFACVYFSYVARTEETRPWANFPFLGTILTKPICYYYVLLSPP